MSDDKTPSTPPPTPSRIITAPRSSEDDETDDHTLRITVAPPAQENLG